MENNAKIVPFFCKEWKRTQRLFHSFIKNGKERKDCSVLMKRTDEQPCIYDCSSECKFRTFRIVLQNVYSGHLGLFFRVYCPGIWECFSEFIIQTFRIVLQNVYSGHFVTPGDFYMLDLLAL